MYHILAKIKKNYIPFHFLKGKHPSEVKERSQFYHYRTHKGRRNRISKADGTDRFRLRSRLRIARLNKAKCPSD